MKQITFVLLLFSSLGFAQKITNSDSLKLVLNKTSEIKVKAATALELVRFYNRINPDSTAVYLTLATTYVEQSKDKKLQARALLSTANHLQNLTLFEKSIKVNHEAIKIYEELNDNQGLASAYNTLGVTYKKNSGDNKHVVPFSRKALAYENKALEYYKLADDKEGFLRVYSNIGIIHRDLEEYKLAEEAFLTGLRIAKEQGIESYSVGILHANLSQIYLDYYKEYDKAIDLLQKALVIYEKNGIRTSQEHAYRNLSYNYSAKKEYQTAIKYANKAVEIALEVKNPHRLKDALSSLWVAQKGAGLYKESVETLERAVFVKDSLLSIEKTGIIAEMNAKFETVKKDAEIKLLNKEAELSKIQKWALAASLLLLLSIGSFIFWSFLQKRNKEKLIAEQETAIQKQKLKNKEIELEFKQKELTSKVLQLARKNEFLNKLENEVETLKTNVDGTVNKASAKISKLLKRDAADDVQWEQFASEFSSLHQGFLDSLITKYGSFTKSEIRLISLMKMNLASKDIADILNISPDGIKKARYRLRKKLKINSDEDIQGFLLSYKS